MPCQGLNLFYYYLHFTIDKLLFIPDTWLVGFVSQISASTLITNKGNKAMILTTKNGNKIYQHPQEVWNDKQCKKHAKKRVKDGYGTKDSRPGAMSNHYGVTLYNGGAAQYKEWCNGENYPYPQITENYKYEYIPSWGVYLQEITNEKELINNIMAKHC